MKLSLLILCLLCVSVITSQMSSWLSNPQLFPSLQDSSLQGPDKGCIHCLRENFRRCYPCLPPCTSGPPSACQNCVRRACQPCVTACSEYEGCSIREGYYRGNSVNGMRPIRVSSLEVCQVKCYNEPTCYIWNYSKERKLCLLRTERRGEILYKGDMISGNKACGAQGGYLGEAYINIGVTCGSGVRKDFCFQCGETFDSCQGADLHPDCILSGNICIPNNRECVPPFRPGPGSNGEPNSLCYYFSNTLVNTWVDAENGCQRMRSNLAPVNASAQQDFIVKVIGPTTSDRTFIGGTSTSDLKFYWLLTSTAVDDGFSFWGPGEPNYKEEQCMEMDKKRYPQPWMWNNVKCGTPYVTGLRSYVCAYDPK